MTLCERCQSSENMVLTYWNRVSEWWRCVKCAKMHARRVQEKRGSVYRSGNKTPERVVECQGEING